jgi:hypothetical protein
MKILKWYCSRASHKYCTGVNLYCSKRLCIELKLQRHIWNLAVVIYWYCNEFSETVVENWYYSRICAIGNQFVKCWSLLKALPCLKKCLSQELLLFRSPIHLYCTAQSFSEKHPMTDCFRVSPIPLVGTHRFVSISFLIFVRVVLCD